MKIVVIGGTGLIGSKVVVALRERGHEAVPASPDSGVDTLTGEGLAEVLEGAEVVVDLSNSPSFADDDVMHFFRTCTANLLAAEAEAGVGHHVALSVVGTDRLPDTVRLSDARIQPMAADDVAAAVGRAATGKPFNGMVEVAGPEQFGLDELIRSGLAFRGDSRTVVTDPDSRYLGARLEKDTVLPGPDAQLAATRFAEWLPRNPPRTGR